MINKSDFNKLSFEQKANICFQNSKYIAVRYYYNHAINLYLHNDFFIEVWYFGYENKITKIETLERNDKKINLYIDYMNKLNNND